MRLRDAPRNIMGHWMQTARRVRWIVWLWLILVPVVAGDTATPVRVLVLYWGSKDSPVNVAFEKGFLGVLRSAIGGAAEYYPEYLETDRFPGDAQAIALRDYLSRKHVDHRIDVVVAMSSASFDYLNRYRQALFPYAPLVFHTTTLPAPSDRLAALNTTGVVIDDAYRRTVEMAVRLHPGTEHLFVISGTREHDGRFEREARDQLRDLQDHASVTYLTDLPVDALLAAVKSVPARSVILYVRQSQDEPGRTLDVTDMLSIVAHSAPAPVYGLSKTFLERGAVGGYVTNPEVDGAKTGEIVLQVLRGTRTADIPVTVVPSTPMFDWRQLQRWGLAEDRLPTGSVVLFREPGVLSRYRWYIAGGASVILAQMALIGGLLVQRERRRRSEAAWRQSEARNLAMRRAMPDLMFLQSTDGVYIDYHARDSSQLLVPPAQFLGRNMRDIMPPELAARFARAVERSVATGDPQEVEYSLPINGRMKHFEARIVPCEHKTVLSIVRDITERKEAEGALQQAREEVIRLTRSTAMGELTASIAHEVNQPLCAIVANARACLNWLESDSPAPDADENLRQALHDVVSDGNRASDVIRRTRELFSEGRVEREAIDVNALISETLALTRARLDVNHVALLVELGSGLDAVWGDHVQIEQVLLNLVANAVDAMQDNVDRPRLLTIRTWCTTDDAYVAVCDTGRGLPSGSEERIFSAFYTTKPDGIGMGLAISHSIVQAHGGRLLAESNPAGGTMFTIVLPLAPDRVAGTVDDRSTVVGTK